MIRQGLFNPTLTPGPIAAKRAILCTMQRVIKRIKDAPTHKFSLGFGVEAMH
jgi:hypothetical protein